MANAIGTGARNISDRELFPVPALTRARSLLPHLRDQHNELAYLQHWLTEDFVRTLWMPAANKVMGVARKNRAKSTEKHRHELSEREAWLHLAIHLAKHARVTAPDYADTAAVLAEATHTLGKARCKAINAASDFSEDDILSLYQYFNELVPRRIASGTVVTIDETIIAYYGRDGKLKGIWRRIPEKPHSKGLLSYRAVTYFKHSMRRAILCLVPLLPSSRLTPSEAAIKITQMLVAGRQGAWHLFLDSGFATQEVFAALPNYGVAYTICVKGQLTGNFSALVAASSAGLPVGRVRTFEHNNQIIQSIAKPKDIDHVTAYSTTVVTTGYCTADGNHVQQFLRTGTHTAAVNMYKDNNLVTLRRLANDTHSASKQEVILKWTGWDPLAPAPDARGVQRFTAEGLRAMEKQLLVDLIAITRGCRAPTGLNKAGMVAMLMSNLPAAEPHAARPDVLTATAGDILDKRSELGTHTSESGLAIANYDSYKGAVDISNEDLYRYIRLAHHRNTRGLLSWTVVYSMVLNAWGSYDEAVLERAHAAEPHLTTAALHARRSSFTHFLLAAVRQIVAKYK